MLKLYGNPILSLHHILQIPKNDRDKSSNFTLGTPSVEFPLIIYDLSFFFLIQR